MSNEKKYTQEEIKAIGDEMLRKANLSRELSTDEMVEVSGGYTAAISGSSYILPKTHEEIDRKWDTVQAALDSYGEDVAYYVALDLRVIGSDASVLHLYKTGALRQHMHDDLDGKLDFNGLDAFSAH